MAEIAKRIESVRGNMQNFTRAVCAPTLPLNVRMIEAFYPSLGQKNPSGYMIIGICMNDPSETTAGYVDEIVQSRDNIDSTAGSYFGTPRDKWHFVPAKKSKIGIEMWARTYDFLLR